MPVYAVDRLDGVLCGLAHRRVLILGLAYRENVKETAFTATKDLIAALKSRGAQVLLNDPLFSREEIEAYGVRHVELNGSLPVDAVILQCHHDAYRTLALSQFEGCQVVLDGRNVLDREAIEAQGMRYLGVGR
jgi:UDP-N-acetyl-D-mannosaminuronic acid dehydrogenase